MVQLNLDPTSLILSQFSDPMNSNNTFQLINDFSYSIERGIRYNDYAQLRESKLQSKRLKLSEIESISEIPTSYYSQLVEKSVNSEEIEIPKSEYSPILKKSVGNDRVSAIPKPGFLRESVSFPVNSLQCEENVQICEIPKSEYSPILKKSVKFHGDLGKLEGNDRVSAIRKPGFMRKSVSFPVNSLQCEENDSPPLKKKHGYSPSRKENISSNVNRIPKVERSVTTPPYTAKRERMNESGSKYGGVGGGGKMGNSVEKPSSEMRKKMMVGRKSYASIEELKGLSIVAGNAINNNNNGESRTRKSNVLRKSTIFTSKYY
ncbi:uncharacterized protein LOC141612484 [Silene latifolia]|uniref:uncharacterized protein LOC141612484 n=1 Tax=Silene latifolia TaxID=37657 RepID=UPI003D76D260